MGQDIRDGQFTPADFAHFEAALKQETDLLHSCFHDQRFVQAHPVAGYELETGLVDEDFNPYPCNDKFLERLDDSLAQFIVRSSPGSTLS